MYFILDIVFIFGAVLLHCRKSSYALYQSLTVVAVINQLRQFFTSDEDKAVHFFCRESPCGPRVQFRTCMIAEWFSGIYYQQQLLSWCFEPSQPQRITLGLNTNFTLSPSYAFHKSSYYKSCYLSLFIFRGHSTREPTSGRVTYFFLRAYTGTMCQPQPTQEKLGEVQEKMQVNGPEGRNKQGRNPWQ